MFCKTECISTCSLVYQTIQNKNVNLLGAMLVAVPSILLYNLKKRIRAKTGIINNSKP